MGYSKELLQAAVRLSGNMSECLRHLGVAVSGKTAHSVRRACLRYGVDICHFGYKPPKGLPRRKKKHWSRYLVKGSKRQTASTIRWALLQSCRVHCCEKCGNDGVWQGETLVLQIDHIDGDGTNNRPANLRFLCPNCHTQTETYGTAKTSRRIVRLCVDCGGLKSDTENVRCNPCYKKHRRTGVPSAGMLSTLVANQPLRDIARIYGVSDKAVAKWCKIRGIVPPGRGYWQKVRSSNGRTGGPQPPNVGS